MTIRELV